MTRRRRQTILISIAALLAVVLLSFVANLDVAKDPKPPRETAAMAAWIAKHPADWLTAAQIADSALDSSLPRRTEIWHASYDLARHLAPRLQNAPAAFVRDGLFHWYELDAPERKAVLDVAAPLMRDPEIFGNLHRPLWDLTHDFEYLVRNAPRDLASLGWLRGMAADNGLFAEYRTTRVTLERERVATLERARTTSAPHELVAMLPRRLRAEDEPAMRLILRIMQEQPFDISRFPDPITGLIEYAIEHHLQPLDGLSPFVQGVRIIPDATRARLAIALNDPDAASLIELGAPATTEDWVPYELDRALLEARRGQTAAAELHLRRAFAHGPDPKVLAAAVQCESILGKQAAAAAFHLQLAATASGQREWNGTCAANELCDLAQANVYSNGMPMVIETAIVQSDEIPPYIEIYADDARVAEGEVIGARRFELSLAPGVHRVEARLVNSRTNAGRQRRIRLS